MVNQNKINKIKQQQERQQNSHVVIFLTTFKYLIFWLKNISTITSIWIDRDDTGHVFKQ